LALAALFDPPFALAIVQSMISCTIRFFFSSGCATSLSRLGARYPSLRRREVGGTTNEHLFRGRPRRFPCRAVVFNTVFFPSRVCPPPSAGPVFPFFLVSPCKSSSGFVRILLFCSSFFVFSYSSLSGFERRVNFPLVWNHAGDSPCDF